MAKYRTKDVEIEAFKHSHCEQYLVQVGDYSTDIRTDIFENLFELISPITKLTEDYCFKKGLLFENDNYTFLVIDFCPVRNQVECFVKRKGIGNFPYMKTYSGEDMLKVCNHGIRYPENPPFVVP